MKVFLTIPLLLYILQNVTMEFQPPRVPIGSNKDTILLGKLLDSFQFECDKYADCVCAEAVRISIESSLQPLVVFISCYSRDARPSLQKGSVYLFALTADLPKRTLFYDPYDSITPGRRYWCTRIKVVE